jgi:hypothetical protein
VADGSGKDRERRSAIPYEKAIQQRDEARAERDRCFDALRGLVQIIFESPRSVHYHAAEERAWDLAIEIVRRGE